MSSTLEEVIKTWQRLLMNTKLSTGLQERTYHNCPFCWLEWLAQSGFPATSPVLRISSGKNTATVQPCLLLGPILMYFQEENHRNIELEIILEILQMRKNEVQKTEVIYSSPNTQEIVGLEPYLLASMASKPNSCFGRIQNSGFHRKLQLYMSHCYLLIYF